MPPGVPRTGAHRACGILGSHVGEPRPRALDLRGLGTRRLQLDGVGPSGHRVLARRRTVASPLDRAWGLAEGASTWINAWEGFRIEVEDFRELEDQRILVLSKGSGRGRASGLELGELTRSAADLLHIHDGKVTRFAVYFDRDHALADLGLKE